MQEEANREQHTIINSQTRMFGEHLKLTSSKLTLMQLGVLNDYNGYRLRWQRKHKRYKKACTLRGVTTVSRRDRTKRSPPRDGGGGVHFRLSQAPSSPPWVQDSIITSSID
ncbi:hypothetical protein LIER_34928 [Lithospermum erythrorhizon]|uniref:Uncharacterized protein n=1 Tax=Lithospermum erythrorhizon TaxID=34254 RepID=A0AAV3NGE2_LITER